MSFETWRAKRVAALFAGTAAAVVTTVLVLAPLGTSTSLAAASMARFRYTPPTTTTTTTTTTSTTTTTTPPAPSGCSGTTPLGLGGTWNCSFDDEFNGTSLNTSLWQPMLTANSLYTAGPDCYVNNPSTISESGGYLNLSAVKVPTFDCIGYYTSQYETGMVTTNGRFKQTYGAFEVNAKLPAGTTPGLQETFWLYPQTLTYGNWPASGEIDFAEFYSQYLNLDIPYIHYSLSSSDPNVTAYNCTIDPTQFNTYGVDWTPTSITILYNGNVCLVDHPINGPAPFNEPFFIALTQALSAPNTNTQFPATTKVDWVRAWTQGS